MEKEQESAVMPPAEPEKPTGAGLVRRLGLFDMTMLVMGSVIGVGIFAAPNAVAEIAGNSAIVLAAWIIGGLVAMAGGLVYAEWTRRRPDVGGQYAFLREAYHPALAFVYGWSLLWIIQSGGMAAVAVVFSEYCLELLSLAGYQVVESDVRILSKGDVLWYMVVKGLIATVAIGTLTIVNCTGVRTGGTTQNIFMVLKILAIGMLLVCGAMFAAGWIDGTAAPSLSPTSAVTGTEGAGFGSVALLGAALVPVFFSYGGWHTTTFVGEEVRDPRKTLSRALVLGILGVIVLYVAVNWVCLRVLGVEYLAQTKKPAAAVMELALGRTGAALISIGIAISALGFLSQATLTSPRVYYAMARDGLFFRSVAWIHPRTRVPAVAILLQGAFAIVIAVTGTFRTIINYTMPVEMLFWSLTALGLFIIRRRDSGSNANLSMPGHPYTTLLFVAVNLAVLAVQSYQEPMKTAIPACIALAAIPVYYYWRHRRS
jgi:APA family basic amino acid/polyamine antiporter